MEDYEEYSNYEEIETEEWALADERYEEMRMAQIEYTDRYFMYLYKINVPSELISYSTSYKTSTSLIIEIKAKPYNSVITLDIPYELYEKVNRIVSGKTPKELAELKFEEIDRRLENE